MTSSVRSLCHSLVRLAAAGAFALLTPWASAFAQGASATTSAAAPAAGSIAGDWDASYNTPGGPRQFKVVFVVDGAKLSGTVKRPTGDAPLTGTVKGDSVSFSWSIVYNDHPLEMSVTAKRTGNAMKGSVSFAGQAQEPFEAARALKQPE